MHWANCTMESRTSGLRVSKNVSGEKKPQPLPWEIESEGPLCLTLLALEHPKQTGFPKWLHSLFLLFFGGEMLRTSWKGMRKWGMRDGTSGPFTWAPEQCPFLHQCWVEFSHYPVHQDPAHLCPDLCQKLLATSQCHKCQDWPGREQSFFSLQTTRVIARVWASSLWKGTWSGPRS